MISLLRIQSFIDVVLEGISFSEFVVVVFHFVPFLQVEVVVGKEVVMVLGSNHFVLVFLFYVFVGIEECCFVLSKLVIVVFVVEVV